MEELREQLGRQVACSSPSPAVVSALFLPREMGTVNSLTGPVLASALPAVGRISVTSPEQPLLLAELAPKKDAEEITGWDAG